jgi:rhomboid protease GluP
MPTRPARSTPRPPRPIVSPPSVEDVSVLDYREDLSEFRQKAIGFGALTVLALVAWISLWNDIPFEMAAPLTGAAGLQAAKNFYRWRQLVRTSPHAKRTHPDRLRAMQQEAVRALADAAKSRAWFTRGIILCCTVPSVVAVVVGLRHAVEVASVAPEAVLGGQPIRMLTGTYFHGSYVHFAGNMGTLLVYGAILESKTSRLRLPLVYLLSALGGSLLSVLMPPATPSIGASGGIVGIIAYLFVFSRRQAVKFTPAFQGATASVFLGLITAGALGFWYIDNPGHAGGAITGFLVAGLTVDTAQNYGQDLDLPLLDLLGWLAAAALVGGAAITCVMLIG